MSVEAKRVKARSLLFADPTKLGLRSCWNCNPAHEHLKDAEYVINCFSCGHYFFEGEDVTEDDDDSSPPNSEGVEP